MELSEALKEAITKPTNQVVLARNLNTCNCIWKHPDTCKLCEIKKGGEIK